MVAYSFDKRFVPAIVAGAKRQTIRGHRRRHARPGEAIQLYTGMRTKACRKILNADPVCRSVMPIVIDLRALENVTLPTSADQINNVVHRNSSLYVILNDDQLIGYEWDHLALSDGFDGWKIEGAQLTPRAAMVRYWLQSHGPVRFEGVMIEWLAP